MTTTWIEQIDAWLRRHRSNYYATLQPGVSERDLVAFEHEFGVVLPSAVRALYTWRNGQADECYDNLVDNWMFPSLQSSADHKRTLDEMIGYDFETHAWWRREWVPFLDNGGGNCLCVDLTKSGAGQVIVFWHDDADRPVESASTADWLRDLSKSMESGAYEFC